MPKVVGVRFRGTGKSYHFDPAGLPIRQGDQVVVNTKQGTEVGQVIDEIIDIPEAQLKAPLKEVVRIADQADLRIMEEHRAKEDEAFAICLEKINRRKLPMNLVEAEYAFDNKKITFYFTADSRVDFRELVKDLAAVFRRRIELRQIGVRDQARMTGGIGVCGRELCCCSFLSDFVPVSIRMAKEQGFSMNPSKISGACGRLMCCFKYEQDAYVDARKRLPRQGDIVRTEQGQGVVTSVHLLKETVQIRLDIGDEKELLTLPASEVEVTGSVRPPRGKKSGARSGSGGRGRSGGKDQGGGS